MDKLTYKGFVWPQNPTEYCQHYQRKPTYAEDETGRDVFLGLSGRRYTITGSGVFTGENACTYFSHLAALCDDPLAGPLVHPVWGTVSAFLTELQMEQDARENCISYSFTFQVADANGCIPQ